MERRSVWVNQFIGIKEGSRCVVYISRAEMKGRYLMRNNLRTLFLSVMILLFCSVAYGADYVENEVIVLTRDSNMTGSALSAAAREGAAAKAAALSTLAIFWHKRWQKPRSYNNKSGFES